MTDFEQTKSAASPYRGTLIGSSERVPITFADQVQTSLMTPGGDNDAQSVANYLNRIKAHNLATEPSDLGPYGVGDMLLVEDELFEVAVTHATTANIFSGTVDVRGSEIGISNQHGNRHSPLGRWTADPDNAIAFILATGIRDLQISIDRESYIAAKGSDVGADDQITALISSGNQTDTVTLTNQLAQSYVSGGDIYLVFTARAAADLKLWASTDGIALQARIFRGTTTTTPLLTHAANTKHLLHRLLEAELRLQDDITGNTNAIDYLKQALTTGSLTDLSEEVTLITAGEDLGNPLTVLGSAPQYRRLVTSSTSTTEVTTGFRYTRYSQLRGLYRRVPAIAGHRARFKMAAHADTDFRGFARGNVLGSDLPDTGEELLNPRGGAIAAIGTIPNGNERRFVMYLKDDVFQDTHSKFWQDTFSDPTLRAAIQSTHDAVQIGSTNTWTLPITPQSTGVQPVLRLDFYDNTNNRLTTTQGLFMSFTNRLVNIGGVTFREFHSISFTGVDPTTSYVGYDYVELAVRVIFSNTQAHSQEYHALDVEGRPPLQRDADDGTPFWDTPNLDTHTWTPVHIWDATSAQLHQELDRFEDEVDEKIADLKHEIEDRLTDLVIHDALMVSALDDPDAASARSELHIPTNYLLSKPVSTIDGVRTTSNPYTVYIQSGVYNLITAPSDMPLNNFRAVVGKHIFDDGRVMYGISTLGRHGWDGFPDLGSFVFNPYDCFKNFYVLSDTRGDSSTNWYSEAALKFNMMNNWQGTGNDIPVVAIVKHGNNTYQWWSGAGHGDDLLWRGRRSVLGVDYSILNRNASTHRGMKTIYDSGSSDDDRTIDVSFRLRGLVNLQDSFHPEPLYLFNSRKTYMRQSSYSEPGLAGQALVKSSTVDDVEHVITLPENPDVTTLYLTNDDGAHFGSRHIIERPPGLITVADMQGQVNGLINKSWNLVRTDWVENESNNNSNEYSKWLYIHMDRVLGDYRKDGLIIEIWRNINNTQTLLSSCPVPWSQFFIGGNGDGHWVGQWRLDTTGNHADDYSIWAQFRIHGNHNRPQFAVSVKPNNRTRTDANTRIVVRVKQ